MKKTVLLTIIILGTLLSSGCSLNKEELIEETKKEKITCVPKEL